MSKLDQYTNSLIDAYITTSQQDVRAKRKLTPQDYLLFRKAAMQEMDNGFEDIPSSSSISSHQSSSQILAQPNLPENLPEKLPEPPIKEEYDEKNEKKEEYKTERPKNNAVYVRPKIKMEVKGDEENKKEMLKMLKSIPG